MNVRDQGRPPPRPADKFDPELSCGDDSSRAGLSYKSGSFHCVMVAGRSGAARGGGGGGLRQSPWSNEWHVIPLAIRSDAASRGSDRLNAGLLHQHGAHPLSCGRPRASATPAGATWRLRCAPGAVAIEVRARSGTGGSTFTAALAIPANRLLWLSRASKSPHDKGEMASVRGAAQGVGAREAQVSGGILDLPSRPNAHG